MNILQIVSLLLMATGFSLIAYALGWLILRILTGRGRDFGSADDVALAPPQPRPVLRLLVGSGRQMFRLLSGRREAA